MLDNLFVCIGAQKAGTTWLHNVLATEPSFSRCPYVKEVHYFDLVHKNSPHLNNWRAHHFLRLARRQPNAAKFNLAREMDRRPNSSVGCTTTQRTVSEGNEGRAYRQLLQPADDDWYCDLLKPSAGQDWAIDVTPDYAVIGAEGFRHMLRVAHNLRLLFILRDPVERAWSGLLQGYKRKPGGIAGFAENALHDIEAIVAACTTGADVGARSDYEVTLDAIATAGLENHALIKFYDEIGDDPDTFMSDVYTHLGMVWRGRADEAETILARRIHVTEDKIEMPKYVKERLKEYYWPKIYRLAERIDLPPSWKNRL